MPSSATITSTDLTTFVSGTQIKSSEMNSNFDTFRGHLLPVSANTSAAADATYDLGSTEYAWANGYIDNLVTATITTSTLVATTLTVTTIVATGGGVAPTGSILAYGAAAAPTGYLLCNGASVSRSTYAALFAVIGTAYGTSDGSSFNVPDLRGRFLRGVDSGEGTDPNAGTRTAMATGGNTGDTVGSVQLDAFQGHYHDLDGVDENIATYQLANVWAATAGNNGGGPSAITVTNPTADGTNGTPRTSSETRPKNAGVHYIIRT